MIAISTVIQIGWIILLGFVGGIVISYNYGWDNGYKSGVEIRKSIDGIFDNIRESKKKLKNINKKISDIKDIITKD